MITERIGVGRMVEPEAMVERPPDEKTQIACVGVMRHALEEEKVRRQDASEREEAERVAALEAAKAAAEAEVPTPGSTCLIRIPQFTSVFGLFVTHLLSGLGRAA